MKATIENWALNNNVTLDYLLVTNSFIIIKVRRKNRFDGCMKEYEELKKLIGWGVGDIRDYSKNVEFFFEKK